MIEYVESHLEIISFSELRLVCVENNKTYLFVDFCLLVVISLYLTNLGLVRSDRLTSIINYIYCFSSTLPPTLSSLLLH